MERPVDREEQYQNRGRRGPKPVCRAGGAKDDLSGRIPSLHAVGDRRRPVAADGAPHGFNGQRNRQRESHSLSSSLAQRGLPARPRGSPRCAANGEGQHLAWKERAWMRKRLAVVLAALFLAACGGGRSTTGPATSSPPATPSPSAPSSLPTVRVAAQRSMAEVGLIWGMQQRFAAQNGFQ